MVGLIGLIPALPLGGAALLLAGKTRFRRWAGWIATATIGSSFFLSLIAFGELLGRPADDRVIGGVVYEWLSVGGLEVDVEFVVDPLTAIMLLVVCGVGSLIHVYSIGYMADDPKFTTFFAYLNLFAGSMLILVLAQSFLVLYVGWELVGLCSFLLISFWHHKPEAAAAGKKAFIVNRIGDLGFLLGILLIYATFGTLDFEKVFASVEAAPLSGAIATWIPLLLFVGAAGKSAQIPLHIWLPDAMEGPTPVSALIHAATMVTAGVYMVARTHVLFEGSVVAATVVAVIGIATALFAATIAMAQDDIKRVLAYSTISQLGYMFLGVGVGAITGSAVAYAAGIFHLVTHAFFKALLFLGAGSVMHATDGQTDMKKMGGLRKALPTTSLTFMIGWLAIIGVPPLSGFFSKDAILGVAWEFGHPIMWSLGIATATLTAFYMSRQVFLTFFGPSRLPETVQPHESPSSMTGPLSALAFLAAIGGWFGLTVHRGRIVRFLEPVFAGVHGEEASALFHVPEVVLAAAALGAAGVGVYVAWRLYLRDGAKERRIALELRFPTPLRVIRNRYYVDEAYGAGIVWPGKQIARVVAFAFDTKVIDGGVNGVGRLVTAGAARLRLTQTGFVRRYMMAMLWGILIIVAIFASGLR